MPVIPVVDLGKLGVDNSPSEASGSEWQRVSEEIKAAFTNIGFVYLKNHGIAEDKVGAVFALSEEFFKLDRDTKRKLQRGVLDIQGYTGPDQERLSEEVKVHELRESFDVHTTDGAFPDDHVPSLRPAVKTLIDECGKLTNILLTAMALSLGLERSYFLKKHENLKNDKNASCMRLLYYPAVPSSVPEPHSSVTGIGAHTDYGTLTLLFQDDTGGLEVKERGGSWVSAKPIPGTILVNVGDILQFWTADRFRATEHRVLNGARSGPRQSVVFFVHPDNDVLVAPYDGSSNYQPMLAREHAIKRFTETYKL